MKDTNLKIKLKTESEPVSLWKRILLQLPSYAMMLTGFLLMMHSVFPSISMVALIVAFILIGAVMLILCNTGNELPAIPIVIAVITVVGLAMSNFLASSASVLIDDVTRKLTLLNGKIYLESGETGNPVFEAACFIFLFAILSGFSVSTGSILPVLPAAVIVAVGAFSGLISSVPGIIIFVIGVVFIPDIINLKTLALRTSIALLCGAIAFSFSDLTMRNASFRGVKRLLHSVVYDSRSNMLGEGDLSDIDALNRNVKPAFEIQMTNPKGMYLKGRVYDSYKGNYWDDADKALISKYENTFYWLHYDKFYGQTQIANAISAVSELKTDEITITVKSACSEYMYTPYMLVSDEMLDPDIIGDTNIKSPGKTTTLKVADYPFDRIGSIQTKVYADGKAEDYLADESAYAYYVNKVDLEMTKEARKYLDKILGDVDKDMSRDEAIKFVKSFLDEKLVYDENATANPGDKDFIEYLFEDSGRGYSVQYATAAVLMLRYLGIPARYVEGYIIPDSSANEMQPGESYIVTENNAHAWAEFYLEGVGFIPLDVTPGYDSLVSGYNGMTNQEETPNEEKPDSNEANPNEEPQTQPEEEPETEPEEQETETQQNKEQATKDQQDAQPNQNADNNLSENDQSGPKVKKPVSETTIALVTILLILLVLLVLLTLIRRILLKLKLAKINNMDNKDAVAALYGYAYYLCEKCGVSSDDDEEMAKINSEARFSLHDISDTDREKMEDYVKQIKKLAEENSSWPKLLKYRYIDCII